MKKTLLRNLHQWHEISNIYFMLPYSLTSFHTCTITILPFPLLSSLMIALLNYDAIRPIFLPRSQAFINQYYLIAIMLNPTRGDHGPVRPRNIKTFLLFIFLKICGAAFMTFHEICKYSILDEKKLNVNIFIKNIQKMISIVKGAYVWQSAFQMYSVFFTSVALKMCCEVHTHTYNLVLGCRSCHTLQQSNRLLLQLNHYFIEYRVINRSKP